MASTPATARSPLRGGKVHFTETYDASGPGPDAQATCLQGVTSSTWIPCRQRHDEAIVVFWSKHACMPCPARQLCTSGRRRQITIRSRELHEALASARTQQTSARLHPHRLTE